MAIRDVTEGSALIGLPKPLMQHVASYLFTKDLCSLIQTCKQQLHACDDVHVWHGLAQRSWPALTMCPTTYPSSKALVLDDNRRGASHEIPLSGLSCLYRFQRYWYFFQCRLLALQWWRTSHTLRLYFESRGEVDLREPIGSSLAVVDVPLELCSTTCQGQYIPPAHPLSAASGPVLAGSSSSSRGRGHQGAPVPPSAAATLRAGQGAAASAPGPSSSTPAAGSSWPQQQQQQQEQEEEASPAAQSSHLLWRHLASDPQSWVRNHEAFYPDASQLFDGRPGYYKGCLIWHQHKLEAIKQLLFPSSNAAGRRAAQPVKSSRRSSTTTAASSSRRSSSGSSSTSAGSSSRRSSSGSSSGVPEVRPDCARCLVFCYASDLGRVQGGQAHQPILTSHRHAPDYTIVPLIVAPPGSTWEELWAPGGPGAAQLVRLGALDGALRHETSEEARARWADLPTAVAARADWWA